MWSIAYCIKSDTAPAAPTDECGGVRVSSLGLVRKLSSSPLGVVESVTVLLPSKSSRISYRFSTSKTVDSLCAYYWGRILTAYVELRGGLPKATRLAVACISLVGHAPVACGLLGSVGCLWNEKPPPKIKTLQGATLSRGPGLARLVK